MESRGALTAASQQSCESYLAWISRNVAATKVRRRVTWDLRNRGREIDPEWANRRRLLRVRECLSDKSFATMRNTVVTEEPSG